MGNPERFLGEVDWKSAGNSAVTALQDLIRIDTTNPPGNEKAACDYLAEAFREAGIDSQVWESAPGRGNVVARIIGSGAKAPLLVSAHLDVVSADPDEWEHDPFGGEIADGYLWGRGAVDMKYAAASALTVMKLVKEHDVELDRDLIFAGVADEEQGGRMGAGFLVDEHRDAIQADFCVTEVGGMVTPMFGSKLAMVQVGHRGFEWVRVKARGRAGHGSLANPDNAIHTVAAGLKRLKGDRVGYHLCGTADAFLKAMASAQGGVRALAANLLRNPVTAPLALGLVPENRRAVITGALYNTAVPTVLRAGREESPNVVYQDAEVTLDGRYLPGVSREEFLEHLQDVLGPELEIEPFRGLPPLEVPLESDLMDTIRETVAAHDPDAKVVPFFTPGFTDAPHYARADITTYGFIPVTLKQDEPFAELYHSPNERISIDGLEGGVKRLADLIIRFCAQ